MMKHLSNNRHKLSGIPEAPPPEYQIMDNTVICHSTELSHILTLATQVDITGVWINSFLTKPLKWKSNTVWISSKLRNRAIKYVNGNRENRNIVKITHW